jgi:hypothetical protein
MYFASIEDLCALPEHDQRVHMCIDFTAYPYLLKTDFPNGFLYTFYTLTLCYIL